MDRHAANGTGQRDGLSDVEPRASNIYGSDKKTVILMVVNRSAVTAGDNLQRTVFQGHIVKHDTNRQDVLVRMGIKCPILVPLDRSAIPRRLHIELASMKPPLRPNQLFNG